MSLIEEEHQLQAQIALHLQAALHLKQDLNACAPINKLLPPDILALIFTHHAIATEEDNLRNLSKLSFYLAHQPIYTWLNVTRVCRRWREVALGCPELWAFVTIDQRVPLWVLERFDVRSGGRPLQVVVHDVHFGHHCGRCMTETQATSRNYSDGLGMLRRIIDRITQLSIFLDNILHPELWAAFQLEARRLESISLEPIGFSANRLISIPSALFASRTPALTSLFLKDVGFSLDNALFCTTLRHLDMRSCRMRSSTDIDSAADLSEFVASLRGMPRLETIKLYGEVPVRTSPVMDGEAVELPYLKLLQVPLEEAFVTGLLACLRIPQSAVRHLAHTTRSHNAYDDPIGVDLLKLLTENPVWAMSCGRGSVDFSYYDDPPRCQIQTEDSASNRVPTAWSDATTACPPRFIIHCRTDRPIMSKLMSALDLRSLRLLSVSGGYGNRHRWIEDYERASQVVTLRVQGELAFGLGAFLARWARPAGTDSRFGRNVDDDTDSGPNSDDIHANVVHREPHDFVGYATATGTLEQDGYEAASGTPLPFPNLRRIELVCVDVPQVDWKHAYQYRYMAQMQHLFWALDGFGDLYGLDVPGLVKGLRARVERGAAQVERVDFEKCQCVERERLRPLVEAVREVWWEGKRLTPDDLGSQEPWNPYGTESEEV